MSWNTFGRHLSFPKPPLCCAECSHGDNSRAFQKKGGEGFSQKHSIQKKPEKMGISLRENGAFNLETVEVITIYGTLCLSCKEAPRMAHLQFTDVQDRPTEFLDLTSLTLDEFQQLVPPFEAAFQAHMAAWRLDGKPRTARRFTVYENCPLPTPEDRLFFILTYLKTYSLQVVQGRLFGMGQSKANQWIHVLLPVLLAALRALGDAPARSLTALAQRLGVTEADAAMVVVPLEEMPPPVAAEPAGVPASPLLPMTGRNGASSAPKTLLNRPTVIAARKKTTR
jgi:Helix-turn-helix of DDE superfamily endonuclease